MVRIGLREIVMDVPAQEVITLDNVSVKVNAEVNAAVDVNAHVKMDVAVHER